MQTINILKLFDVLSIFLSSQVKRCMTITYKHGIFELPQELPNDFRLRFLGNEEILEKCLTFIEWEARSQSSSENENFVNTSKNLLKNRN